MLRLETETGWWLVTHPDHARLAGAVAELWGNEMFRAPEPREPVLLGINVHDDGWAAGCEAFDHEAREAGGVFGGAGGEVFGVRGDRSSGLSTRAGAGGGGDRVEERYAALLVSKHTYNLLTARADRSTIAAEQLPLLDEFLERQRELQKALFTAIRSDNAFSVEDVSEGRIEEHFRLLQAADNMSLLACVTMPGRRRCCIRCR